MVGTIAIVLVTLWTAFVVETIIESARAFGGSIVFLGRTLLMPGVRPGILILCGLAATAGLAWTAALAYERGRRLERRMAAELDVRYREMTAEAAGDIARAGLLSWRVAELRTSMDDLLERRDGILAEMELTRRRTSELRALSQDYKRSLAELQDRLIFLPEMEDELARRRSKRQAADPAG
jgi:ABC-type anion transport system duplicated permease subunit